MFYKLKLQNKQMIICKGGIYISKKYHVGMFKNMPKKDRNKKKKVRVYWLVENNYVGI